MIGRPLLALTVLLASASSASAATRLESTKRTASTDISFVGTGCLTRSTRTIVLPEQATSVDVIEPDIGTDLFAAGNTDPIATIRSLDSSTKKVTWIASGAGASCAPGNEEQRWETAIILLKVEYTVQRRVLTRSTVLQRGDAICRDGLAKQRAFQATKPGPASRYAGIAKIVRGMMRRLKALAIPNEQQSTFHRFTNALDRAQQASDRAAAAVRRRDEGDERASAAEGLAALADARSAAKRYGFRGSCRQ